VIRYSAFTGYWRKKWEYNGTVDQLFIYFVRACEEGREDLYNILTEFSIPMMLARLIKICLNVTYNKVCIGKHLSDAFPIQNCLKQGDILSPLFFNFALEYAITKVQKVRKGWNQMEHISSWYVLIILIY
jgi:hypothetical protein